MCESCAHDLYVPKKQTKSIAGKVFCSNTGCRYFKKAHPTGKELNKGLTAA